MFFFNDTATTEIYTLSLHDALPISRRRWTSTTSGRRCRRSARSTTTPTACTPTPTTRPSPPPAHTRSEEHTSELQSRQYLVCRLLLEKKNTNKLQHTIISTLTTVRD